MKQLLLALALVLSASFAYAEQINFTWSQPTQDIDGMRIYVDTQSVIALDNISPSATAVGVVFDLGGKCHRFFARNFVGKKESVNSDIADVCPAGVDPPPIDQPPPPSGSFKFSGTITPIP